MTTDQGKILIADDENSFARPLAELFRREGFHAVCAHDAESAQRELLNGDFDLLISDIHMPGNRALEMITGLPQISEGLPVILLTGNPSIETAVKSVQLSLVAYLIKPPDFDQLLELARTAIRNHRAWRAARASRKRLEQWINDLALVEQGLRKNPEAAGAQSSADFVSLTVSNLLGSLHEFQEMVRLMSTAAGSRESVQGANVIHALQKAVDVLEKTRRNFKSMELRDLRVEMEQLLNQLQNKPEAK